LYFSNGKFNLSAVMFQSVESILFTVDTRKSGSIRYSHWYTVDFFWFWVCWCV